MCLNCLFVRTHRQYKHKNNFKLLWFGLLKTLFKAKKILVFLALENKWDGKLTSFSAIMIRTISPLMIRSDLIRGAFDLPESGLEIMILIHRFI